MMIQQPPPSTAQPPAAAAAPLYIDTQHEDLVHDAQMDFYGSKLATCSSGRWYIYDSIVICCCFAFALDALLTVLVVHFLGPCCF
jgi:hypothetical protein